MSAPNLREIEWAIHELEQEESSFPVYAKLANLYTVRNEMIEASAPQVAAYSFHVQTRVHFIFKKAKSPALEVLDLSHSNSLKPLRL